MRARTGVALAILLSAMGCGGSGDGPENNNTPHNNNDGGLPPAPTLLSVDPGSGPRGGSTAVTLTGTDLQAGLTVRFGTQDATDVEWISATEVRCVTPPAAAPGPVNVRVINPDLQYAELFSGFVYEEEVPPRDVDGCSLRGPATLSGDVGQPTQPVFGRVHVEGVTDLVGPGDDVLGELGWGPEGSDPSSDPGWQWRPAVYAQDASQIDDEYVANIVPDATGTFSYAFRFSADHGSTWLHCDLDGSENGYDSAAAGVLGVGGSTGPITVSAVDLPRGSVLGGSQVTITGAGFTTDATVQFGAAPSPAVSLISATALTAIVPPGPVGPADVVVSQPTGSASLVGGFEYLLVDTVTVDGDLTEWDPALQVAVNTVPSSWTSANELTSLHVAFDDTHLYVGIDATVESANAVVAYLDVDFGAATGITDTNVITDTNGLLDQALGGSGAGSLQLTAAGFGADFALGSVGMGEALGALSDVAGLRGLSNPSDLPWLLATVDAGNHVLECSLPLAELFSGGVPASGASVALVVKIANGSGESFPDQTLPEEAATSTVSQFYSLRLYPAGSF